MTEDGPHSDDLEQRIEQLERENERLRERLREHGETPPGGEPPDDSAKSGGGGHPPVQQIEWWVEKIGIALLTLGLGLFIYLAVDRGWLTPAAAVAAGLLAGGGLGIGGWLIYDRRRDTGQMLMGAASAVMYLTLYAAYGEFELIPYAVAFGAMTAVVIATFAVSLAERLPAIAAIGAIGGFATPLLVSTDGNIPGLMTYTAILVAGMTTIYLVRDWRRLLALSAVGGWAFAIYAGLNAGDGDRLFAQFGTAVVWFCTGVVPTLRTWLKAPLQDDPADVRTRLAAVLAIISGALGFLFTLAIWEFPEWLTIAMGLVFAALATGAAHFLSRRLSGALVSAYRMLVPCALLPAFYEMVPDGHFAPVVALVAVATHYMAAEYSDRALRFIGHLVTLPLVFAVFGILLEVSGSPPPFLHLEGVEMALVVATFFGAAFIIRNNTDQKPYRNFERVVYRWTAHGLALTYLAIELMRVGEGNVPVTVGWAVYAVALLVAGLVDSNDEWKHAGLVAVLATVAKLLLVDLQTLDLVWRILLFCGFGLALLLVSRFTPAFDQNDDSEEGGENTRG